MCYWRLLMGRGSNNIQGESGSCLWTELSERREARKENKPTLRSGPGVIEQPIKRGR